MDASGQRYDAQQYVGRPVSELPTPAITIDLDAVHRNSVAMAARLRRAGVALRPHLKAHRCPAIADIQRRAARGGVAAAKVSEAAVFVAHGYDDVFVANPIGSPSAAYRLAIPAGEARIRVCVDSAAGAILLDSAARRTGTTIDVLIETESELCRTGVAIDATVGLAASVMRLAHLRLTGVCIYAGKGPLTDRVAVERTVRAEIDAACTAAQKLRARGLPADVISVGGTATAWHLPAGVAVTEARPGTYALSNAQYAEAGYHDLDDCALTVHTTVTSSRDTGHCVVDAGRNVLGDLAATTPRTAVRGRTAVLDRVWEENGGLTYVDGPAPRVGDVVALVPARNAPAINQVDEMYGVRDGVVVEILDVAARGKSQ